MRTLGEIVDDYNRLSKEATEYMDSVLMPQLEACKTYEQYLSLREQISLETCDEDGTIRPVPPEIELAMLWAGVLLNPDEPPLPTLSLQAGAKPTPGGAAEV